MSSVADARRVAQNSGREPATRGDPGNTTGQEVRRRRDHLSVWVGGLFAFGLVAFLYFGKPFLLPLTVAILTALALRPVVRALASLRMPEWLAALLVLTVGTLLLGVGAYKLSEPAAEWLQRSPSVYQDIDRLIRKVQTPISAIGTIAHKAEEAARAGEPKARKPATAPQPVDAGALSKVLLLGTWTAAWGAMKLVAGLVLLYFVLAAGDHFLRELVRAIPRLRDRVTAVSIARSIERGIGHYLLSLTAINTGIGVAVALVAMLVGLPNPALWGALAAVLHFVPYLGAAVSMTILSAVAFVTIPELEHALVVPLAYLVIIFVESQIVQPLVFGHRHALNPVVIFVALLFWTWVWGIPGALVAVPMLIVIKVTCDHIEPLQPVAALLGPPEHKSLSNGDEIK
jgi:predicted PurR-regulated permease PerM